MLKDISRAETAAEARERCAEFAEAMEDKTAKAIACLEASIEDTLVLPAKYRRRMKSTNMQERLIRIFRNEDSALRLVGALLAEINEEWQERRYLDMDEFHEWLAERQTDTIDDVIEVN